MNWIDWTLICVPVGIVVLVAWHVRRYVRSVSDFLAAGRVAGRYLVANAEGTAAMGAITIVATFELLYRAGTTVGWWQTIQTPVWIFLTVGGFVVYRYRETRAMTMAQFLEMRYSRRFRVFMGSVAWIAGLVNYGIFPVVSAKFFATFLALPPVINLGAVAIPTYVLIMAVLISANVFFVTLGGQLIAMVTDCIEGLIGGLMLLALMIGVCYVFTWQQMATALTSRPVGESLINPFDAGQISDFNIWFVIIGILSGIYSYMAWQGNSGFNASAASPHEAKMGRILGQWRAYARASAITLLGIGALTYMHHPDFAAGAQKVTAEVQAVSSQMPASQAVVPVAVREFLPAGLRGMFVAVMLFAVLACDASYMHSWGSIFVQDVLLPIRQARGKPQLSPEAHLRWLRRSIIGVAVFAFIFGILYRQSDYILMFFALTGAIFLGGAGSCIIGGLYWSRGTTAGAWAGMIVGSSLAVMGIVAQQVVPDLPLNGQWMSFIAMISAVVVYISVSLLTVRSPHNMDKLLHRGRYAVDPVTGEPMPSIIRRDSRWRTLLGMDSDFSRADKAQSVLLFSWSFAWFAAFAVITTWNLVDRWPAQWWVNWTLFVTVVLAIAVSIVTTIWFTWGGIRDLRRLFVALRTLPIDRDDDGTVSHTAPADPPLPASLAPASQFDGREPAVVPPELRSSR